MNDFFSRENPIDFGSPNGRLKAHLLIGNPPYVRHHHLSQHDKEPFRAAAESVTGVRLSGLAEGCYGVPTVDTVRI